jgi:hypothetical protein
MNSPHRKPGKSVFKAGKEYSMRRKIMNKWMRVTTVMLIAALALTGCVTIDFGGDGLRTIRGSGNLVTEERPVSGIERIALYGIGEVEVTLGASETLVIEAEDNLLQYLETEVDNGVLELRTRNLINLQPRKDIRYTVTVKSIDGLEILGSGNITLDQADVPSMRLLIAGSGGIHVGDLKADALDITIPGSGKIQVSGEVERQTINVAGSGKVQANDLRSQSAEVRLAGSGDMTIWVVEDLTVRILGSGDIRYYGSPSVSQTILGSGNVTSLGTK